MPADRYVPGFSVQHARAIRESVQFHSTLGLFAEICDLSSNSTQIKKERPISANAQAQMPAFQAMVCS